MDFFGRVVDQEGNGVENVTIHYKVGKAGNYLDSGIIKNTDERKETTTQRRPKTLPPMSEFDLELLSDRSLRLFLPTASLC